MPTKRPLSMLHLAGKASICRRPANSALGGMNQPPVRQAQEVDFPALQFIERTAASRFAESDLPVELRERSLDVDELRAAMNQGLLWVVDLQAELAGFLAARQEISSLHIVEMSVLPEHGRRGFGGSLLEIAKLEARNRGLASITLTTFSHVPWNAPAYARAGFREIAESSLSPELARRLAAERKQGLVNRVAMQCNGSSGISVGS